MYANLLADSERLSQMEPRERALLTALLYGVIERRLTLDYAIGVLASRAADSLTPHTRVALRLGLYQLFYMNIPPHAAVSETVSLGKSKGERALINAVLRAAAAYPEGVPPPPAARSLVRHLSVLHSVPAETVRYFLSRIGEEETRALLASFCTRPPLFLRVNTRKTDRDTYLAVLREAGLSAMPDPLTPHGIRLTDAIPTASLPGYAEGLFFVQDAASQLTTEVLSPLGGHRVLDLCACPGGKSFGAAMAAGDKADVLSRDIHASKLSLIRQGALRLGLSSVRTAEWDATVPDPALCGKIDRVICDVPCSGLGVIAKKPDLRYRSLSGLSELTALSARILDAAAEALAPRGVLLFSTCTLTREENEDTVKAFLARHPRLAAEDFSVGSLRSEAGMLTLWPHRHGTDGFFMAKIRRL